ncbi:DUF3168 domain-containing protein [Lactiplantibacillus plantarum]|uniref:DUF3168 domain-containing protein n=1 Tax=Lactiplantibacillus plantarum TaxID=1590 RepID=UPI0011CBF4C2|nr:DUF3168 domain-containing protein [Lactiplantibacillus plantarum]MCW6147745.1 DUF3168 domain-containing protein [Lactiplantibacillus plantarum]TXJ69113.1 DUF3168 domain-containing protein [Lactiplantibacillus plantarum]TXJ73184.1 DUF3168 domain-containing protein [Lactiplantibacillus plantarum]TXJ96504.1 DUF3168 domain-containing protein [Lactiplantibacillus plantarum]
MSPEEDLLLSVKQCLRALNVPIYDLGQQRPTKFPQVVVSLQNEQEQTDIKVLDYFLGTVAVDVYTDLANVGQAYALGRKVANAMQRLKLAEWPSKYSSSSMSKLNDNSLEGRPLNRLAYLFDIFVYGK